MNVIHKSGRNIAEDFIATNSLAIESEDLVSLSGGFAVKAVATGVIEGVSKTEKTFAADNETLAKGKVTVVNDEDLRLKLTADATIADADVNSFFAINVDQTVDVSTKASTQGALQLQLVEVITSTVGIFKTVK